MKEFFKNNWHYIFLVALLIGAALYIRRERVYEITLKTCTGGITEGRFTSNSEITFFVDGECGDLYAKGTTFKMFLAHNIKSIKQVNVR